MNVQHEEAWRWLRFAERDLASARTLLEAGDPGNASFLAQQAAEKAVKATLIAHRIEFPFVHDLEALVALAPGTAQVRATGADLESLSEYAVAPRYPSEYEQPDAAAAKTAIEDARRVVDAVRRDLQEIE
jgi:HEPN domain-containing protein